MRPRLSRQQSSGKVGIRVERDTVVPALKTLILSQLPALKTTFFPKARCPADIQYNHMGVAFLPHGAPKITAVVHLQSCTESGLLLLTLLRAGMERFLPSASGSSAAGLKPCGEPTCKFKSQLVTSVHQCPCGRSMHGLSLCVSTAVHVSCFLFLG